MTPDQRLVPTEINEYSSLVGTPEDIVCEEGIEVLPSEVPDWVIKGITMFTGWVLAPDENGGYFNVPACHWDKDPRYLQKAVDSTRSRGVVYAAKVFQIPKGARPSSKHQGTWVARRIAVELNPGLVRDLLDLGKHPQDITAKGWSGYRFTPQQLRGAAKRYDNLQTSRAVNSDSSCHQSPHFGEIISLPK
jgi:hypothetical protein